MSGFDGLTNLLPNVPIPEFSDAAFSAAWDALNSTAPSRDAIYTEVEKLPTLLSSSVGTYTPTISSLSNCSVTGTTGTYLQLGPLVFVFGQTNPSATAAAASGFNVSLPIASNMTIVGDLNGCLAASGTGVRAGSIQGDITAKNARFGWNQNGAGGSGGMAYIYMYRIV